MTFPGFQFPPRHWPGGHYSFLLASLILMFAANPLLQNTQFARAVLDVLMSVVLLFAVLALGNRGILWMIAVGIIAVELVGVVVGWLADTQGSWGSGPGGTLRLIAAIVFFAYIVGVIFRDLMRMRRVSVDAIFGAMCVYLMLGLLWACAYLLIAHYVPGSFQVGDQLLAATAVEDPEAAFSLLTYFSFVTLTTLGFGDIMPVSPIARTACWMEAIAGQLFLATFVAGMVGMHIADRMERREADQP